MRKVIAGAVALLIVGAGVGGYFGAAYWVQRTAEREVDAMLAAWGASAGKATRRRVAFDLWTRTLRVADVVVQSQASPDSKASIAQVVASGIDTTGRADRLELVGLELSDTLPSQPGGRIEQKVPRVTLTGYSARPTPPRKVASALDMVRVSLEQFSTITAASIEIPSLSVTVTPAGSDGRPDAPGRAEYTYTDIAMRDVRNGRVAETTVGHIGLRSDIGHPIKEINGEIGKASITDSDVGPLLAFLDPSRPREEGYQRLYRHLSAGPYTLRLSDGTRLGIDSIAAEDIGLRPTKLSLDDIIFLSEVTAPAGRLASPVQVTMLIDKIAGLYEGIRIGKLEMLGMSIKGARDNARIGGLQIRGLENGRLAEFALETIESEAATKESVSIGRIAFKGFDLANLLRVASTRLASAPPQSAPDQLLGMLALLEGVDLNGITIPDPKTRRVMRLEALSASWGAFVGGIPSRARLSGKLSAPISADDPEPFIRMLVGRGMPSLAASFDVGATWTEAGQMLALAPATMEIGDLVAVSVKASVGNVPRQLFTTEPAQLMGAALLAEAGPIEVSLRDLGAVDLAAAEAGRTKGAGLEEGRAVLVAALAQKAETLSQASPEAVAFLQAVTRFVKGKGETLTVTLTPKSRVGLLQLVEAGRSGDPLTALMANFTVEVRSGG